MNGEKYNGWTNYATWRVNLELIADLEPDYFGEPDTIGDLAEAIEQYVDDVLTESGTSGLVLDYACAFTSDVDWYEIARSFSSDNDELKYDSDGDLIEEEK